MEVIKDINFTGDISINGSNDYYNLDLYVPINSEIRSCQTSENDIHNATRGVSDTEINVLNSEKVLSNREIRGTVNQTSESDEFESKNKNHRKTHNNPFVIFIHGGGWRRGARDAWTHYLYYDVNFLVSLSVWMFGSYSNVGESLAQNGVPCAVISYPLTELGTPLILVEMLASYIQSCLVTFMTLFISLAIALLYRLASDAHSFSQWSYMHGRIIHWKEKLLLVMLVTNLITACLFTFRRNKFNLTRTYVVCLWLYMLICCIPFKSHSMFWLGQLVVGTFLGVQFTILCLRLKRAGRSVTDQVKVVAKAIQWVERSCRRTNTDLYLMGHSAGGHLACLTVIDERAIKAEGCSITNIKGVISISGVYDVIDTLNKAVVRNLYLHPTFGFKKTQWLNASPHHLIQNEKLQRLPPFLLISAEKDLFLKQQSQQFYKALQEAEVDCSHIEIKRTNHFTVIVNFKQSYMDSEFSAISDVINFILRQRS